MARYPAAQWRGPVPSSNYTPGGNNPRYHIIHIMEGTLAGTDSEFRTPDIQLSAHFGIGKDGTVYQWVDTADIAYHAAAANDHSVGVEHEGFSGFPLTLRQLAASARLFAWVHQQHPGVPFRLASDPVNGAGLAWHGMGGASWGNHPYCPGVPIRAQLPSLLAGALKGKIPPSGHAGLPGAVAPGAAKSTAARALLVLAAGGLAAVAITGAVVFLTSGAGLAAAAAVTGRKTRPDF